MWHPDCSQSGPPQPLLSVKGVRVDVTIAATADHASTTPDNKLNIIGIFDSIAARSFPVKHAFMVLALRVRVGWEDRERDHPIRVQLEDEDGRKIIALRGVLSVGDVPPGEFLNLTQIFALRDVLFEQPGSYVLRVIVDGIEAAEQPLRLIREAEEAA